MVAIRLAQPLGLHPNDAGRALERLLAEKREGPVSAIRIAGLCLVRMIRRRDVAGLLACVMVWEPVGPETCSFIGSLSIVSGAAGDSSAFKLEGMAQLHGLTRFRDEGWAQASAEATGRAVLERIGSELAGHALCIAPAGLTAGNGQCFTRNAAPVLHAAGATRASTG